ncbi:MAG: citrate lyase holo-[acyl-carrier protein] synthase [Lachnospiraceae bacterium]|nr:citrate lyase holo-[acyl-carrier protein] synthase [Lachnospiraceae bacterium]
MNLQKSNFGVTWKDGVRIDYVLVDIRSGEGAGMENREVSLMEVLEFRDRKAVVQKELGQCSPDGTVVSLGLNIPGPVKSDPLLQEAFLEGRKELEQMFLRYGGRVLLTKALEETAGYAAVYLVVGIDSFLLKRAAVQIEEAHALGRLFDVDVLGEGREPLTRERIGAQRRTCLLCGKDAKICARSRAHSVEELQKKVWEILTQWKEGQEA